ncbi:tyrosine-type recombinase/integrase [Clostridium perfringens]|uniref:tyrosine-type recombinase/integrase n=1 Tax=Clostridium perfringens TaxID=1502 RepID=UPI0024BC717E|nr:tyrosine-type recombinase/integrase [Clostridium perfringens]
MNNTITLHGMEWNLSNSYNYSFSKSNTLMKFLEKSDKLPLTKGDICFSSLIWDFKDYTTLNIPKSKLKFNFTNIPEDFIKISKMYVLIKILANDNKIQTINKNFISIRKFFNYLNRNNIFDITSVTANDISNFIYKIKQTKISLGTLKHYLDSIKDFYIFYSSNYEDIYTNEIKELCNQIDYKQYKQYKENNKLPAIPNDYLQKLLSLFISTMNDTSKDIDSRAFACIMLIESQTGLRVSDLTDIKTNQLKIEKYANKEYYYLKYFTFKREKGNNVSSETYIFINELSYKAYMILDELYKEDRKERNSNLLYIPTTATNLPVKDSYIRNKMKLFILENHKILKSINVKGSLKDLKGSISIKSLIHNRRSIKNYPDLKESDVLSYPLTHQFRVNVCTELYHKGVPLQYIQEYMTHLSSDMQDYYIRPKKSYQEDIVYSKQILSDIVTGEVKLLGKNVKAMTDKIKDYIENGKFNVAKDLDQIIDELTKKIPIRAKLGGICIKSSMLRDCSKDAKTDEFFCAYGVCPNHFHVFYMADITYERYLTLKNTYTYNKNNNFLRQAEKEKFKILNTIKDSLLPELDEVKNEVLSKGEEAIKENYPQLTFIIENFDIIYKEVISWIK